MSRNTDWLERLPEATRNWLGGARLEEVECIIADLPGIARGKAMPATTFARAGRMYLPDSIFYQTVSGGWAEFGGGDDRYTEPDMVLTPDFATACAAPWAADKTIQIIHDVDQRDGTPVACAPRNVLKRVLARFAAEGWQPVVAPELEFYLVAPNTDPAQPVEPPYGRSGRRVAASQVYSMSAVDEFGPIIDDIYDFAEAMGFEIDTIIQEGGAGQLEFNLPHGDALALADQVFFFKRLIREAALRHDCYATFMAKPMQDQPGSAMHVHASLLDRKTGTNLFSGDGGAETPAFHHFIGGLQTHLPTAIALIAPYVNSYRRYVPEHSAPVNLEWGRDNRTTGLRVPIAPPPATRVENRLAGMDCNPYLGIAATLACGYLGMKEACDPRAEIVKSAYGATDQIPQSLREALIAFDAETPLRDILGTAFCEVYSAVKWAEHEEFFQIISPWEREHLLVNV